MTKDTLYLTRTAFKFKTVEKDRLFYNRFKYCIGFQLNEVSCLRELDHDLIDQQILRRQQWREQSLMRWRSSQKNIATLTSRARREIQASTVEDLHTLASVLLDTASDFKLVVSMDQAHVYSNDSALIAQVDCLPMLRNKTHTRAKVTRPKNTIQLKNPLYQYRTYFKVTKLTTVQKQQLVDFLNNQAPYIRISPALKQWFGQSFNRTQDYFFVDYNGSSWSSMLALVAPGLTRKTLNIIATK
jgi:hypothetical protein